MEVQRDVWRRRIRSPLFWIAGLAGAAAVAAVAYYLLTLFLIMLANLGIGTTCSPGCGPS